MRAEFACAPNLTIVDTPGFILKARKGEADSTPDDILAMVKAQCAPPNRLILFLQQSSVEWCSSMWMHIIQEVDPHFQRTGGGAGQGADSSACVLWGLHLQAGYVCAAKQSSVCPGVDAPI